MKKLTTVPHGLIDNLELFDDPFFSGRTLTPADQAVTFPEQEAKIYSFPTFFNQVQFGMGVFTCDYKKAQSLLPAGLQPVKAFGGRALAIIASYEYRKIHQMTPYNELLVMLPVLNNNVPGKVWDLPMLPSLVPGYNGYGYYTLALPMSSEENKHRGHQLWGLPKTLHDIEIGQADGKMKTTVFDDDGKAIISLNIPMAGKTKATQMLNKLFSEKDGKLVTSENHLFADMNENKHLSRLFSNDNKTGTVELGQHEIADKLRYLQLAPDPIITRYTNDLKTCLFLPKK